MRVRFGTVREWQVAMVKWMSMSDRSYADIARRNGVPIPQTSSHVNRVVPAESISKNTSLWTWSSDFGFIRSQTSQDSEAIAENSQVGKVPRTENSAVPVSDSEDLGT